MSDSLRATEASSAAVQKTPNRVALADIEDAIEAEFYVDADTLAMASFKSGNANVRNRDRPLQGRPEMKASTICLIIMENGFQVIGFSAPADPANYDAALGRQYAREHAIRQLWPLMGFALRDKLHAAPADEHAAFGDTLQKTIEGEDDGA